MYKKILEYFYIQFLLYLDREDEPVAYNNDRAGCRSISRNSC